jgi:NAD(P)-dependent dehydrogenase (short-subunit alcohol dehydrogenase family)
MPTRELSGTTALVTGASRGFGRAIAIALSGQGPDIISGCASNLQGAKIIFETSQARDVRLSASCVQTATRPAAVSPHYAAARGSRYPVTSADAAAAAS